YSFFYTLYLLITLNPKLIVVHWASRLYQNILLALWGRRVIVHTMGGDIDSAQDCCGKKRFFVMLLLKACKVVSIKTPYMQEMLEKSSILISQKIVQISFGVEERFFKQIFKVEKRVLQKELFGAEFEYLFFSVRALNAFYHSKEIIEAFLSLFENFHKVGLIVSTMRKDKALWDCLPKGFGNVIFTEIPHKQMDKYLLASDCVISYSKSDGFSQSIMESMANGKMIIINNLPNYKGILNANNALMFENTEGLKGSMDKAFQDKMQGVCVNASWLHQGTQREYYLQVLRENFNV
ncbi:glycosyltransferase, partial [Helicobacter sp.]|uniref:glycosyltransferase n=1 Tax=Helicobacter sp. TaxID=218 RepID=UPI0025C303B8